MYLCYRLTYYLNLPDLISLLQIPAISLAYEEAETNIMTRPPRDPKYDKLVNFRMISYTYLQIGIIQSLSGFVTYFVVMAENGFLPMELFQIRDVWDERHIDDVTDSYGQQWSYAQRKNLEDCAQTAYFFAIVIVQWADLIVARTRTASLLSHPFSNWMLLVGLLSTLTIAYTCIYAPYLNGMLGITGLR